jgi:hypothetical protein
MKPVWWMAAASVTSWLVATLIVGRETSLEVLCGMLGPLAVASVTWILVERTYRRNPEGLTGIMATAFFGKLVFFGVYVAVMLRVVSLRPVPFVVSFVCYFIALYLMDMMYLRRLFSGRSS